MIKFVVSKKKLLIFINRLSLLKRFFVYDFSKLNSISDDSLYNLVFSHIVVSNGLTKTTRSNRFEDLDNITLSLLQQNQKISFHDIGVSNGITSLQLFDKMQMSGLASTFYISDKYARIYYKGGGIKKFYDADGNLISVNFLFVHLSPHIGKVFFLSRWLFKLYQKKTTIDNTFCEILLLAPAVYRKVQEGSLHLLDFDVFETNAGLPFNFLRCVNVLMAGYFSRERIQQGVLNLQHNLQEGGYLLLGRTDASNVNHATFYLLENSRLQPVKVINNGFDYNNPL